MPLVRRKISSMTMPLDTSLPTIDVRADFWSLRFVESRAPLDYKGIMHIT
jgi:hypothetical protein